jgi:branched-chain amino acid transport system ATP-binding protein
MRDFHMTVLLVEHDMELVMNIADDMTVLNFGRRIAGGTPQEVQANQDVIDAYLGVEDDEDAEN